MVLLDSSFFLFSSQPGIESGRESLVLSRALNLLSLECLESLSLESYL